MTTTRRFARLALATGFAGLLIMACAIAADAPHGAMAMDAQQTRIDQLLQDQDPLAPPGVDVDFWHKVLIPRDNALTSARIALGRKLYFETRLSADGTVACATCHDASRGFTDQRMVAEGIGDKLGQRNSPTALNAAFMQTQFWDGRAASLEAQARLPIVNPIEMGHPDEKAALAAIAKDPQYVEMFQSAYGRAPNFDDLARAIASFERTLVFLDAPFDRWQAGDEQAVSESAKRGFVLFEGKARCASCHMINGANPLGTDHRFHNIGVSARNQNFESLAHKALALLDENDGAEEVDRLALETDMSELGRFLVTKNYADIGSFKTEQLRNLGITAPYMHDGTLTTLWDVVDHYNKGGEANPYLDGGIEPLALSENEIDDLVAFLFTLTDVRFAEANQAAIRSQQARAAKQRPFRDTALAERRVLPFEDRVFGGPALGIQGDMP